MTHEQINNWINELEEEVDRIRERTEETASMEDKEEEENPVDRMRKQNRIAEVVARDMEKVGSIYNRDFHRNEEMVQRLAQRIACRVLDDDFETR